MFRLRTFLISFVALTTPVAFDASSSVAKELVFFDCAGLFASPGTLSERLLKSYSQALEIYRVNLPLEDFERIVSEMLESGNYYRLEGIRETEPEHAFIVNLGRAKDRNVFANGEKLDAAEFDATVRKQLEEFLRTASHDRGLVETSVEETRNVGKIGAKVLSGHTREVHFAQTSSDLRFALTSDVGGSVIFWDLKTGKALHRFEGLQRFKHDMYDISSSLIVVNEEFSQALAVRKTPEGSRLVSLDLRKGVMTDLPPALNETVSSLSVRPDFKRVMIYGETRAELWDLASGQRLGEPFPHQATHYPFLTNWSLNRAYIYDGGKDAIWDIKETPHPILNFSPNPPRAGGLHFSDGFERIFAPSLAVQQRDLIAWDGKNGGYLGHLHGHTDSVKVYLPNADGTRLLSSAQNETILWDVDGLRPIHIWRRPNKHQIGPNFAKLYPSADFKRAILREEDGNFVLLNLETGGIDGEFALDKGNVLSAVSKDNRKVLTTNGPHVSAWDLEKGEALFDTPNIHQGWLRGASFSSNENNLISYSHSGEVIFWDIEHLNGPSR